MNAVKAIALVPVTKLPDCSPPEDIAPNVADVRFVAAENRLVLFATPP